MLLVPYDANNTNHWYISLMSHGSDNLPLICPSPWPLRLKFLDPNGIYLQASFIMTLLTVHTDICHDFNQYLTTCTCNSPLLLVIPQEC